jgi:hypothetical protein
VRLADDLRAHRPAQQGGLDLGEFGGARAATGVDVVCPVKPGTIMVVLSPRKTAVEAFLRLHDLPPGRLGPSRTLLLNGINVTARELEQAVGRHAGNRKVGKVVWQHDRRSRRSATAGPRASIRRARALGFETDKDLRRNRCATSSPTTLTIRCKDARNLVDGDRGTTHCPFGSVICSKRPKAGVERLAFVATVSSSPERRSGSCRACR